jgi:hypothetical protein
MTRTSGSRIAARSDTVATNIPTAVKNPKRTLQPGGIALMRAAGAAAAKSRSAPTRKLKRLIELSSG